MTTEATQFAGDAAEGDDTHEPGLPRVGDVVDGKYRVDRVLGSGGMGIVVAAENLAIGVPVAMKFLRPSVAKDNEAIERFKMEARASMRIHSEHVARVQDVATLAGPAGTPYMLMEYLEGEDLGQLTERGEILPISTAVDFLLEACEAIAEAHALGIVHRDLKPSNLFLARRHDGSLCLKVLDFGISKAMGEGDQNPNMTDTRATFGSPTYMSPEQIRSSKRVDFRTDIWALGVCLHEILAGRPPFEAENVSGLLASIIADPPTTLRQHRADAPEGLEEVVLQCLQKDLTRRFQSIAELAVALQPYATRGSMTSFERVMRMSQPPPAASSSTKIEALRPSSPALEHARTEKSFGTSNSIAAGELARPATRSRKGVLLGGAAAAIVVIGLVGVRVIAHPATTSASGPPVDLAPDRVGARATTNAATNPEPQPPPTATSTAVMVEVPPANPATAGASKPGASAPAAASSIAPTAPAPHHPGASVTAAAPGKPAASTQPAAAPTVSAAPVPPPVPTAKPAASAAFESQF